MRMRIIRVLGTLAASAALAAGLATAPPASAAQAGAVSSHHVIAYVVVTDREDKGWVVPVDTYTGTALKPIEVGDNPLAAVITPNGLYAYVANEAPPVSVSVISTRTSSVVKTIPIPLGIGNNPTTIGITPNGKTVYVSFGYGIVPILTAGNKRLKPIYLRPVSWMTFTPDSKTLYVNGVVPISTATNRAGKPLDVNSSGGAAFSPDGKTMYLAGGTTITPVSVTTGKPGRPIQVAQAPQLSGIVISPDGRTAYVGILPSPTGLNGVIPVNLVTRKAAPLIHERGLPNWMLLTPDGKTLYIVHQAYNDVSAIRVATRTVLPTINVGEGPVGAAIGPEGKALYVLCYDVLSQISAATSKAVRTIPLPGTPVAIGFFLQ